MKTALRHILCLISLFLLTISLNGQNSKEHDAILDRYELLCGECLELRTLVAEGVEVSRARAAGLINDFVTMNREIKADSASLNSGQQSRFKMINHWFTTGNRPMAMDHAGMERVHPDLKSAAVSAPNNDSGATAGVQQEQDGISAAPHHLPAGIETYIMADFSLPLSYGLMAGLQESRHPDDKGIRWGGYMRFRSNFIFQKAGYICLSNGTIDGGYAFLGNGNSQNTNIMATAGVLAGLTSWLELYAGAGYGQKQLLWQDIDGSWASVSDFTHKGMALEIGLITSFRTLCLGLGISTVNFRTASLDLSVGIRF